MPLPRACMVTHDQNSHSHSSHAAHRIPATSPLVIQTSGRVSIAALQLPYKHLFTTIPYLIGLIHCVYRCSYILSYVSMFRLRAASYLCWIHVYSPQCLINVQLYLAFLLVLS